MANIFCSACNADNHPNSAKCEQCGIKLTNKEDYLENDDEWEKDFLFIENAELNGKVFKLENLEESDEVNLELNKQYGHILQPIKEEPELQIGLDISAGHKKEEADAESPQHNNCLKEKVSPSSNANEQLLQSDSESQEDSESKTERPLSKKQTYSKNHETHMKLMRNYERLNSTPTNILNCDLCNLSFVSSSDLKVHRRICKTKQKFFCDICKIFVSSKNALKKHNNSRTHNYYLDNPRTEEKLKFVCIFCDEKFSLQILLTNHKKNHLEEYRLICETSRTKIVNGRKIYACLCGKTSKNKWSHSEHLRVHTKENPAECGLCQSTFTRLGSANIYTNLPPPDRPFKCQICQRCYRNKSALRKHLFLHTGQKPFKCKCCGQEFSHGYILNDHFRRHHAT